MNLIMCVELNSEKAVISALNADSLSPTCVFFYDYWT